MIFEIDRKKMSQERESNERADHYIALYLPSNSLQAFDSKELVLIDLDGTEDHFVNTIVSGYPIR